MYRLAIETRAVPVGGPRPCPRPGGTVLRALLVGLCALVLVTQAAAAAKQEHPADPQRRAKQERVAQPLEAQLAKKLDAARQYRGTIRFFRSHRSLLSSAEHRADGRVALRRAKRILAKTTRTIAAIRKVLRQREARRRAAMSPRLEICDVFGRYCEQAVAVAWCESRLQTTAQNGQYLGLFQMGSSERRLFGHGRTAQQQASAAHKYFVDSGQDWSPWSCKPWYAS